MKKKLLSVLVCIMTIITLFTSLGAATVSAAGVTGLVKKGNNYYYYVNGVRKYTNQFVKHGNYYYYVVNGVKVNTTGLQKSGNNHYYLINGVRQYSNCLVKHGDYYYYVQNGVRQHNAGLVKHGNYYYYVYNGVKQNFTGLVKHGNYYYYVLNGVKQNFNGLVKHGNYYYHVANGVKQNTTCLVKHGDYYYYVKNGVRQNNNGLVPHGKYYYYVKNGVRQHNTGYIINTDGKRYYVQNGVTSCAAVGHRYSAATCTKPATCTLCAATKGTKAAHTFNQGYCKTCGAKDPNYKFDAYVNGVGYKIGTKLKIEVCLQTTDKTVEVCPCLKFSKKSGNTWRYTEAGENFDANISLWPSMGDVLESDSAVYGYWVWLDNNRNWAEGYEPEYQAKTDFTDPQIIATCEYTVSQKGEFKITVSDGKDADQADNKYTKSLSLKIKEIK